MSDVLPNNIHAAMRAVAMALRSDGENKQSETYSQYLQCISFIIQTLLQDFSAQGVEHFTVTPFTVKYVKLAEQCLERIESLVGSIGSTGPNQAPTSHNSPSLPRPPPLPPQPATTITQHVQSRPQPLPRQPQLSRQQATNDISDYAPPAYVARTQYSRDSTQYSRPTSRPRVLQPQLQRSRSIELSLSLQRKLMENAEIAKSRKAALKRKMEEQQQRLEAEARIRFSSSDDQAFYATVLTYEQNTVWPVAWRTRLSQSPDDERLVQLMIQQILRTPDHPITAEIIKTRYELYTRISPLLADHIGELEAVKVTMKPESNDVTENEAKDGTESMTSWEYVRNDDKMEQSDDSKVEMTEAHDGSAVCSSGLPYKGLWKNETEIPDLSYSDSLLDDVVGCDGDQSHAAATDAVSSRVADVDRGDALSNSEPTASEDQNRPVVIARSESEPNLASAVVTTIATAEPRSSGGNPPPAHQYHLKMALQHVHQALAKLTHYFLVAYQSLDNPGGREMIAIAVEDALFEQLWQYVIVLFRLANIEKELCLARLMSRYCGRMPQEFGVRDKFALISDDVTNRHGAFIPYHEAVVETQRIAQLQSPMKKLECLVGVSMNVCKAVDEFQSKMDDDTRSLSSLGADDLIPILAYVIVQSGCPQLVSECAAMEEFIHEDVLFGEEGYALASFNTCLQFLLSMEKDN